RRESFAPRVSAICVRLRVYGSWICSPRDHKYSSEAECRSCESSRLVVLNSPEINPPAILLQHGFTMFTPVTCPSNREGSGQSRGAPGCPFSFGRARPAKWRREACIEQDDSPLYRRRSGDNLTF